MNFEKHAQHGNEFINGLAKEIGVEKGDAARILKATLKALRKRVSPEEYLDFIAQLPYCIKAVAIDGWRLSEFPDKEIKNVDDFIQAIIDMDPVPGKDFSSGNAKDIVQKVLHYLKESVSEGEASDIENNLPKAIREFFEEA
ncbi:DUF2267 domain-containing protein [Hydrogenimonas sp.]